MEEMLPVPQQGEARVRVLAAGVSAFDLIYRRWPHLPGSPDLPFTLGEDIVGVIDCLGEGVAGLKKGQLVAGATWAGGIGGGYAEYVSLPVSELVPVPGGVDPAEAVCVVVNYLTAHLHLHQYGQVQPGERLLVHGAAGGVGTALLELGRLAGLDMYGTAGRDDHDLVTALGATPIDYQRDDFVERIRLLTNDGVDVVVDPVGGAKHLWDSYPPVGLISLSSPGRPIGLARFRSDRDSGAADGAIEYGDGLSPQGCSGPKAGAPLCDYGQTCPEASRLVSRHPSRFADLGRERRLGARRR